MKKLLSILGCISLTSALTLSPSISWGIGFNDTENCHQQYREYFNRNCTGATGSDTNCIYTDYASTHCGNGQTSAGNTVLVCNGSCGGGGGIGSLSMSNIPYAEATINDGFPPPPTTQTDDSVPAGEETIDPVVETPDSCTWELVSDSGCPTSGGSNSCPCLGYVYKLTMRTKCDLKYIPCPFDPTYVKLDSYAKPGDIKFSYKQQDHDGWYLANGRDFPNIESQNAGNVGYLLSTLYGSEKIPNLNGVYIRTMGQQTNYNGTSAPIISGVEGAIDGPATLGYHKHSSCAATMACATTAIPAISAGALSSSSIYKKAIEASTAVGTTTEIDGTTDEIGEEDSDPEPIHRNLNVFIYLGI